MTIGAEKFYVDKRAIMVRAWVIFRECGKQFGQCLKMAWAEVKKKVNQMTKKATLIIAPDGEKAIDITNMYRNDRQAEIKSFLKENKITVKQEEFLKDIVSEISDICWNYEEKAVIKADEKRLIIAANQRIIRNILAAPISEVLDDFGYRPWNSGKKESADTTYKSFLQVLNMLRITRKRTYMDGLDKIKAGD